MFLVIEMGLLRLFNLILFINSFFNMLIVRLIICLFFLIVLLSDLNILNCNLN